MGHARELTSFACVWLRLSNNRVRAWTKDAASLADIKARLCNNNTVLIAGNLASYREVTETA